MEIDQIKLFLDKGLNTETRTICVNAGIDSGSSESLDKRLSLLEQLGDEPIQISLNTRGGCVLAGLRMYDRIRSCKSTVTIHVPGLCASMGAVILQAADHRTISENATIMIHNGQLGIYAENKGNFENWQAHYAKLELRTTEILLNEMRTKKKKLTLDQLQEDMEYDLLYTAKQAKSVGLVDKVV